MAKNKGLTLEDLMKGRESIQEEQRGEGVGMRNAIAAAVTPSLTPIAQSLGKLQQVTETAELEKGQISSISAVDKSVSKAIVDTSKNIEKLLTSSNDLNKLINDNNGILSKQLEETKAFNKYSVKMFEELVERINRDKERGVSGDLPSKIQQTVKEAQIAQEVGKTEGRGAGFNISLPKSIPNIGGAPGGGKAPGGQASTKAGSVATAASIGSMFTKGLSVLARGGMGGLIAGATYALLPDEIRKQANEYGVDEERAIVYGTALGLAKNPYTALLAALGVGLYELDRNVIKNIPEEEKQKAAAVANIAGAASPSSEADAIRLGGRTEEQYEAERLSDIRDRVAERREQGSHLIAPVRNVLATAPIEPVVQRPNLQAAANVTVVTADTSDIPEDKAVEILGPAITGGSQALNWKNMSPQDRSKRLRMAKSKGVNLNVSVSAPEITPPQTSATPSTRFGTFNLSTSEEGRNAGTTAAPTIIRGGDTINNVTNVTGGSGGSSGPGSPSILFNPWDPLSIGRVWRPYASSWGG